MQVLAGRGGCVEARWDGSDTVRALYMDGSFLATINPQQRLKKFVTQVEKRIRSHYCSISEFGPNDGITPLADEVTENGIVVTELGLDHYYKSPDIDKKTIALALMVAEEQK